MSRARSDKTFSVPAFPVTQGYPSLGWVPPWDPNYPKGGNPVPGQVNVPWTPPQDPVRVQAKSSAQHSLKIGLFITLLTGIATGLTAIPSGTNWFTKDGLIITGVILVNSVVHSFLTYANQLGWGPPGAGAEGTSDGKCSS